MIELVNSFNRACPLALEAAIGLLSLGALNTEELSMMMKSQSLNMDW